MPTTTEFLFLLTLEQSSWLSSGHPRRCPPGSKTSSETKTASTHGKVADEVPDETT